MLIFYGLAFASASGGNVRYTKAYGKKYVYLRDVANYYGMKNFIWKQKCGMYSKYSRLEFIYDKKEASVNGVKVHLFHPAFLKGYDAFISEEDFLKCVDPVLRPKALRSHRMKVIMLDPGHGGDDKGGTGRLYEEKALVLNIALRLRDILRKEGYIVYMTRTGDRFLSLEQRSAAAAKYHADIFVSIHANVAGNKSVSGIESFSLAPVGTASTNGSKTNWSKDSGNSFDRNNNALAYYIHSELISKTKAVDRGVKRAQFAVLKNAPCPAVLLEVGFLSNSMEERALGRASYQQALAEAIAKGITDYHKALRR